MAVLMFQHRFAPLVESGQKRQTIRPKRKRPIKAGDKLSLRQWTGVAYRSKQRVLRDAECLQVCTARIIKNGVMVESNPGWMWLGDDSCNDFAKADGFADWADMVTWFGSTHGLPFEGELIKW